jgi:hypothetical protein
VLVDGADALPAIADAIESAESHVWLAGWHFSPEFRLPSGQSLRELLAEGRRPRAREDPDRRRPLADDRLGERERALALQRHREERRDARPGAGA